MRYCDYIAICGDVDIANCNTLDIAGGIGRKDSHPAMRVVGIQAFNVDIRNRSFKTAAQPVTGVQRHHVVEGRSTQIHDPPVMASSIEMDAVHIKPDRIPCVKIKTDVLNGKVIHLRQLATVCCRVPERETIYGQTFYVLETENASQMEIPVEIIGSDGSIRQLLVQGRADGIPPLV